jgi:hypothetical protein
MSIKLFIEIFEDFVEQIYPNQNQSEDEVKLPDNNTSDRLCDYYLNYIMIKFLHMCSYFDKKNENELKYDVY